MSLKMAGPKGQGRVKNKPLYNGFCAILSFATVMIAFTNVSLERLDESAELFIDPMQIDKLLASREAAPTLENFSVAAAFVGPNRDAKTDRRRGPTAMEVAQSFAQTRFKLAEARAPKVEMPDPIMVAAIGDTPKKTRTPGEDVELVAAPQEMPKMAALKAIDAISGTAENGPDAVDRDPNLPFPVKVPTKLAYARDNAPKTTDLTAPLTQASMDADKREKWCMATAIYFEARGEKYRGQVAVAQVVRNRVKHKAYPNTICGVVFQNQTWRNRCQFSFACDGIPERVNEKGAWATAEEIAHKVIRGDIYLPEVSNSTHYHADYVNPHWASRLKRMTKIGTHIFYRFKRG
ncbi:cell wall hydrolase [Maritalea mediterranea]|uniref:Cell wall hydrolase n=1 Tax=Maritalea mediterranea TaxID=2909667 RepID=A0ABS9E7W4_9HYPH|nr:cell wall hydrolase [Maritalea mediterranea]MCF4097860.1 cell wall hydrolase [Maritalea mediterranea]